jgi:hypothetical protein
MTSKPFPHENNKLSHPTTDEFHDEEMSRDTLSQCSSRTTVFSLPKRLISSILISLFSIAMPMMHDVAFARPEGVNKPELLPKEPTTVIDVANYLR